jgi:hypothetical protein
MLGLCTNLPAQFLPQSFEPAIDAGAPDAGPTTRAAVAAEKKFKGLSGDLGYASIDADYGIYGGSRVMTVGSFSLNGDTYQEGKRPFAHLSYKINPALTAFGFYTHAIGKNVPNDNQQGIHAGLNFDLKALVNSQKLVF